MEDLLYRHLERIRQIDRILKAPVESLIGMAAEGGSSEHPAPLRFTRWVAEQGKPQQGQFRTTSALCISTLQRIRRGRRRFDWLKSDRRLDRLGERIRASFSPGKPRATQTQKFDQLVKILSSETFGPLNALTAAQVFRVLLQEGEGEAHGGLGFLGFFTMIWSLERRYPDPLARGASLGPWGPTAYVSAKCLLPIARTSRICQVRAKYLQQAAATLDELSVAAAGAGEYDHWRFACSCEQLSKTLFDLVEIALQPEKVRASAERLADIADSLAAVDQWGSESEDRWREALDGVDTALRAIGAASREMTREVAATLNQVDRRILGQLREEPAKWGRESEDEVWSPLSKHFLEEWGQWGQDMRYVEDLRQSCANALAFCRRALGKLKEVHLAVAALDGEGPGEGTEQPEAGPKSEETGAGGEQPKAVPEAESVKTRLAERSRRLQAAMRQMAKTYLEIHKDVDRTVADDARWCRNIMERQIAHVSAGNYTEFDPAELVSAIAVSVSWRQLNTPLQVKDAVAKALEGARDDGSWGPGRPFYPHKDALGAWALTSDVVATLVGAIERYPEVEVADEALLQYVDWLERTRIQVDSEGTLVTGWASDRAPHHTRVDLWATCYAIEALLEIRDLLEFRLWQLCARRFTVIADVSPLGSIDPVDLGQSHIRRLHRRLYRMARMTQGDEFAKGDYSLVLHGPPGSSKTKVAEAISAEMWMSSSRWGERSPRLVRITPADFTRGGEERIDSEARIIFDLLRGVRGVTIFFDEIDDLLRRRDPERHPSFIELVIPAMLNRLQDLRDACPRQEISFLIATNYIEKIEPALIRKGRIDEAIPVTYPDTESRLMMLDQGARQLEAELKGGSKKAKAAVRSGFVREGAEAVRSLSGAPWTAVNTLLKGARKAILEAHARGAPSSPLALFAREAREVKAAVSPPDYAARRPAVVTNSNLRREYFAQLWASRTYPGGLAFAVEAWSGLGGQGNPPPEFRHEALKFTTARLGQSTGEARTRPGSGGGEGVGDAAPAPSPGAASNGGTVALS